MDDKTRAIFYYELAARFADDIMHCVQFHTEGWINETCELEIRTSLRAIIYDGLANRAEEEPPEGRCHWAWESPATFG